MSVPTKHLPLALANILQRDPPPQRKPIKPLGPARPAVLPPLAAPTGPPRPDGPPAAPLALPALGLLGRRKSTEKAEKVFNIKSDHQLAYRLALQGQAGALPPVARRQPGGPPGPNPRRRPSGGLTPQQPPAPGSEAGPPSARTPASHPLASARESAGVKTPRAVRLPARPKEMPAEASPRALHAGRGALKIAKRSDPLGASIPRVAMHKVGGASPHPPSARSRGQLEGRFRAEREAREAEKQRFLLRTGKAAATPSNGQPSPGDEPAQASAGQATADLSESTQRRSGQRPRALSPRALDSPVWRRPTGGEVASTPSSGTPARSARSGGSLEMDGLEEGSPAAPESAVRQLQRLEAERRQRALVFEAEREGRRAVERGQAEARRWASRCEGQTRLQLLLHQRFAAAEQEARHFLVLEERQVRRIIQDHIHSESYGLVMRQAPGPFGSAAVADVVVVAPALGDRLCELEAAVRAEIAAEAHAQRVLLTAMAAVAPVPEAGDLAATAMDVLRTAELVARRAIAQQESLGLEVRRLTLQPAGAAPPGAAPPMGRPTAARAAKKRRAQEKAAQQHAQYWPHLPEDGAELRRWGAAARCIQRHAKGWLTRLRVKRIRALWVAHTDQVRPTTPLILYRSESGVLSFIDSGVWRTDPDALSPGSSAPSADVQSQAAVAVAPGGQGGSGPQGEEDDEYESDYTEVELSGEEGPSGLP